MLDVVGEADVADDCRHGRVGQCHTKGGAPSAVVLELRCFEAEVAADGKEVGIPCEDGLAVLLIDGSGLVLSSVVGVVQPPEITVAVVGGKAFGGDDEVFDDEECYSRRDRASYNMSYQLAIEGSRYINLMANEFNAFMMLYAPLIFGKENTITKKYKRGELH